MKRCLKFAVLMGWIAMSFATLHADLIVCPQDDFFVEHEEECEYVGRLYKAAGKNGSVFVYSSPISNEIVGEIPNGVDIMIDFTYENEEGVLWGVQTPQYDLKQGQWMNLTEFQITKTREDFELEHQDNIELINEVYSFEEQRGYLALWDYPGSEHISAVFNCQDYEVGSTLPITKKYKDEKGLIWLFIDLNFHQQGWMQEGQKLAQRRPQNYCYLDEGTYAPATPTPYPTAPTARVPLPSPTPMIGAVDPYINPKPDLMPGIAAGIAGVIVVTALIIHRFWKK